MTDQITELENAGLQNDDEPNSGWKMKDKIISMHLYIFQPCDLVRHFPCPIFSSM